MYEGVCKVRKVIGTKVIAYQVAHIMLVRFMRLWNDSEMPYEHYVYIFKYIVL